MIAVQLKVNEELVIFEAFKFVGPVVSVVNSKNGVATPLIVPATGRIENLFTAPGFRPVNVYVLFCVVFTRPSPSITSYPVAPAGASQAI